MDEDEEVKLLALNLVQAIWVQDLLHVPSSWTILLLLYQLRYLSSAPVPVLSRRSG